MKQIRLNRQGFTIVELLIVVVVIAILAAISIVAYNGIQSRAQLSSANAQINQFQKKLELHKADTSEYPSLISDCPTPATGNLCLANSSDTSVRYQRLSAPSYSQIITPGYELASMQSSQFAYKSTVETIGYSEFNRYTDFAPYIDRYGLKRYRLEYEAKSANISSNSNVNVYFQNGSGARYSFGATLPITTSYTKQTLEFTPTNSTMSMTEAYLAFYGVYGTGNVISVKNVSLQLAS